MAFSKGQKKHIRKQKSIIRRTLNPTEINNAIKELKGRLIHKLTYKNMADEEKEITDTPVEEKAETEEEV